MTTTITVNWNDEKTTVELFLLDRKAVEKYLKANPQVAVLRQASAAAIQQTMEEKSEVLPVAVLSYVLPDGKCTHARMSQVFIDTYDLAKYFPSTIAEWTTQLEGPTHLIPIQEPGSEEEEPGSEDEEPGSEEEEPGKAAASC
jgi:uncharacterized protein Usg